MTRGGHKFPPFNFIPLSFRIILSFFFFKRVNGSIISYLVSDLCHSFLLLAMDEKLIQRLESAVSRLESLSAGFHPSATQSGGADAPDAALDPSIVAFADLIDQYVGRVSGAAEVIGGQVLDVTKLVQEAFNVQKELLIKLKQTQVRHC